MDVVVDIGNTSLKLGVFERGNLMRKQVLQNWEEPDILTFLTNQTVQNLILSNVAQSLSEGIITHLRKKYFCVFLDHNTPLPIKNLYETPHSLGKDRIAAVVGAFSLFPDGLPCDRCRNLYHV